MRFYAFIIMLMMVLPLIACSSGGLTGGVTVDVDSLQDKSGPGTGDVELMNTALDNSNVNYCHQIERVDIRDDCYIKLADKLQDDSVCGFISAQRQDACLALIH